MPERQLVGVNEGAAQLGLSPWTLRAWAYKGRIASHKIGTRLMFDKAEISRIITETERPRLTKAA